MKFNLSLRLSNLSMPKPLVAGLCSSSFSPVAGFMEIDTDPASGPTASRQWSSCPIKRARILKFTSRKPSILNVPSAWLNTEVLCLRSSSKAETITPAITLPDASVTLPLIVAARD